MAINVFLATVAIGALAELITWDKPNNYEKATTVGTLLLVAFVIAWLPEEGGWWALTGLAIARIGDLLGQAVDFLLVAILDWKVRREEGDGWATPPNPRAEWHER